MKSNIGKTDKIIRIVLGLVIVALGIYFKSWWGLVAILPLGTALVNVCGIYAIFGLSTCPMETAKEK